MENLDNFYSRAGGFARVLTGLLDRIIVRHLELGYAPLAPTMSQAVSAKHL